MNDLGYYPDDFEDNLYDVDESLAHDLERELDPIDEENNDDDKEEPLEEPSCDVFDLDDDSSSFESIGWGTDEDYGYYAEDW